MCHNSSVFLARWFPLSMIVVVRVDYMIKSSCMFCNVWNFITMCCISDMFFYSGAKRSFCFADVIPLTWCMGDYLNNVVLIIFERLNLGNRKFLLQCFCWFVEDLANLCICLWRSHADVKSTLNWFFLLPEFLHWHEINILLFLKGPLKYLLMPLLGKNQLAITLHLYASTGPNLDNTHRGHI